MAALAIGPPGARQEPVQWPEALPGPRDGEQALWRRSCADRERKRMMMIGYARITRDSDIAARQDHELSALDCDRLYLDQPGGGRRRPGLAAALQSMEFGDCLAVWRLAALKLGAGGLR